MSAVLNSATEFAAQGGYAYTSAASPNPVQGWSSVGDDFKIVRPFADQQTGTWTNVIIMLDRPRVNRDDIVATKLRSLHAWLDSLPEVPSIPLEALDRGHLY